MDFTEISFQRQQNQQLFTQDFNSAGQLLKHFGAVQAKDYAMAKWALGVRLPGISDAEIDKALESGEIVRTHVLRPTWHFAPSEDIGWMLDLSSKNIRGQMASNDRKLGLDGKTYAKCFGLIERALENQSLSRSEIIQMLAANGVRTDEFRSSHILVSAEMEQLIVSGGPLGKEQTYALMSNQVKNPRKLSRAEALAELAFRYFNSHGPATLKDFQWWSGLNQTDCKNGIQLNIERFQSTEIDGQAYYFTQIHKTPNTKSVHLLPAFDEFLISYKDRSASIDPMHNRHAFTLNGIFKPILVIDGQVCGIWKRSVKKETVYINIEMVAKVPKNRYPEIKNEARRFADFLGLKMELSL